MAGKISEDEDIVTLAGGELIPIVSGGVNKTTTPAEIKTYLESIATSAVTLVWGADTTAPSLGNGTLVGRAAKLGPFIWVSFRLAAGSTTTFGSGPFYLQLPSPFDASAVAYCVGSLIGFDAGTAFRCGNCSVASGQNKIRFSSEGGANNWGAAVPQTWAVNDYLMGSILIPVA